MPGWSVEPESPVGSAPAARRGSSPRPARIRSASQRLRYSARRAYAYRVAGPCEGSLDAGHGQALFQLATELVEWFNAVDATYRSDVRAIADAQSARIDAQMGQLRAELRQEIGGLGADLRQEIGELRAEMRAGFTRADERLNGRMEGLKAELLRWMFLFWVGSMGTIIAILKL